jgi:hypothetical protein
MNGQVGASWHLGDRADRAKEARNIAKVAGGCSP